MFIIKCMTYRLQKGAWDLSFKINFYKIVYYNKKYKN